jgi:hypothetical protein
MQIKSMALAMLLGVAAVGAPIVQPAAAAATKDSAASAAPVQPELGSLLGARGKELADAGVQRILAQIGKNRRGIRVYTKWGVSYQRWPANVEPVAFDLMVTGTGEATVRSSTYTETAKPQYAAAFDALLPRAIASARNAQVQKEQSP